MEDNATRATCELSRDAWHALRYSEGRAGTCKDRTPVGVPPSVPPDYRSLAVEVLKDRWHWPLSLMMEPSEYPLEIALPVEELFARLPDLDALAAGLTA